MQQASAAFPCRAAIGLLLNRCQFLRVLKLDGCRCVGRVKAASQTLTTLWLAGCDRLLFLVSYQRS